MKLTAAILLLTAILITCLTSCNQLRTYSGPPITGSLEYQGFKVSGTIHPTK